MGLEEFQLTPGSIEFHLETIRDCQVSRRSCRIVAVDGNEFVGIPTIDGGAPKRVVLRNEDGELAYVPVDQIRSVEPVAVRDDAYFMSVAIQQARRCKQEQGAKVPKPLVGAVLVENTVIIETAYRGEQAPGDHAEFTLLQKKLPEEAHRAAGTTLYTTLEPCTERGPGKTPCVDHILRRRIQRVVIGILDPNAKIRGEGIWLLRERGVDVALCTSLQMAEIEEVCARFVAHHRPRVPRRVPWWKRLVGL